MKPPICELCSDNQDIEAYKLIYFKPTEKDLEWEKDMKENRKHGHPLYAVWVCEMHLKIAEKYQELTREQAMKMILSHEPNI